METLSFDEYMALRDFKKKFGIPKMTFVSHETSELLQTMEDFGWIIRAGNRYKLTEIGIENLEGVK